MKCWFQRQRSLWAMLCKLNKRNETKRNEKAHEINLESKQTTTSDKHNKQNNNEQTPAKHTYRKKQAEKRNNKNFMIRMGKGVIAGEKREHTRMPLWSGQEETSNLRLKPLHRLWLTGNRSSEVVVVIFSGQLCPSFHQWIYEGTPPPVKLPSTCFVYNLSFSLAFRFFFLNS